MIGEVFMLDMCSQRSGMLKMGSMAASKGGGGAGSSKVSLYHSMDRNASPSSTSGRTHLHVSHHPPIVEVSPHLLICLGHAVGEAGDLVPFHVVLVNREVGFHSVALLVQIVAGLVVHLMYKSRKFQGIREFQMAVAM